MVANFLNSEKLNEMFDVHFVYCYSERYEEGVKRRIKDMSKSEGIELLVETGQSKYITSKVALIALLQKLVWAVVYIVNKYYSIYSNTKKLQKVFTKYSPDIVHINNGGYPAAASAQAAVIAAHRCGVKYIYYVVNNMAMSYTHPFRWLDVFVDPYIKKYVTKFITGSNNAGNHLKSVLGLSDLKQITLRNGIVQRSTTMSVADFKSKYGIPEGKLVFSTIANLELRKGHRYLLQAILELKEKGKIDNCLFVLEGKGERELFIKSYITEHGLNDMVKLISVDAIYDLYKVTDVTILPSIAKEDFPNTIIESMGMGIPVIGTRIAGIPEQIVPDRTGILIEPANVTQLKAAIVKMIENESFRMLCGEQAKIVFLENYTAERSVVSYIEIYKQCNQ